MTDPTVPGGPPTAEIAVPPVAVPAPATPAVTTTAAGFLTGRGETTISPVVAEKIAARAASEVDGVGGVLRTGLSRLLPWTTAAGPASADAAIDHGTVTVDLTVNVVYPCPVGAVTAEVRAQVTRQLADLCGLRAGRVDIVVPELVRPAAAARRRVE